MYVRRETHMYISFLYWLCSAYNENAGKRKKRNASEILREPGIFKLSTRGSVIAGSLKLRASDDRDRTTEDAREGVRCTCLYLFFIINAALPRISRRRPADFTGLYSSYRVASPPPLISRDSLRFFIIIEISFRFA